MKWEIVMLCLVGLVLNVSAQITTNIWPELHTSVGTFKNAHIGTIGRDYVTILHDQGGGRVAMTNLPDWLQKRLGYSPEPLETQNTNLVVIQFSPPPQMSTNDVLAKQLEAASRAMPSYFEIKKDPVTGVITIDQPDFDSLDSGVGVEVLCSIEEHQQFPTKFLFHIHSSSSEWRFLEYHAIFVRAGEIKKDYGEPQDYSHVGDYGVTEGFFLDWTMDELHDFAWADDFIFKLGTSNFRVTADQRQKWKLLWKYFSLKKQLSTEGLKSIVND